MGRDQVAGRPSDPPCMVTCLGPYCTPTAGRVPVFLPPWEQVHDYPIGMSSYPPTFSCTEVQEKVGGIGTEPTDCRTRPFGGLPTDFSICTPGTALTQGRGPWDTLGIFPSHVSPIRKVTVIVGASGVAAIAAAPCVDTIPVYQWGLSLRDRKSRQKIVAIVATGGAGLTPPGRRPAPPQFGILG